MKGLVGTAGDQGKKGDSGVKGQPVRTRTTLVLHISISDFTVETSLVSPINNKSPKHIVCQPCVYWTFEKYRPVLLRRLASDAGFHPGSPGQSTTGSKL